MPYRSPSYMALDGLCRRDGGERRRDWISTHRLVELRGTGAERSTLLLARQRCPRATGLVDIREWGVEFRINLTLAFQRFEAFERGGKRESVCILKGVSQTEHGRFSEMPAENLQSDGQSFRRVTARDAHARDTREIAGDGVDVGEVHGHGVSHFFAQFEGGEGRDG